MIEFQKKKSVNEASVGILQDEEARAKIRRLTASMYELSYVLGRKLAIAALMRNAGFDRDYICLYVGVSTQFGNEIPAAQEMNDAIEKLSKRN